jgi:hypothetical protein
LAKSSDLTTQLVNPGDLGAKLSDLVRHLQAALQVGQALNPFLPGVEELAALLDPAGHVQCWLWRHASLLGHLLPPSLCACRQHDAQHDCDEHGNQYCEQDSRPV